MTRIFKPPVWVHFHAAADTAGKSNNAAPLPPTSKDKPNKMVSPPSSVPTDRVDNMPLPSTSVSTNTSEAVRLLLLDTIHQGALLSTVISKLPKLEKVLESAKELQQLSPIRYQSYVSSAENTLDAARNERDKNLMNYLNKLLELVRYEHSQVLNALNLAQNGDISSREKAVAELLSNHLELLYKNTKADPSLYLSSFTERFSNFID